MLSVVSIKSSSVSSNYYLNQDGGYYIEDSNNPDLYQWYGKGAEKLGLRGQVEEEAFKSVFSGQLPNGESVGKVNSEGVRAGRPGYDLTFSMNKDLSLIISCTKDKSLRDYFLQAHIHAVRTALGEVEKKVQARGTVQGVTNYEYTGKMVAALCTHFSSRAGDPQIHTHACVANVTERADGQWRALATDMQRNHGFFEAVRDNAIYFGAIYQNELACSVKQKGFEIEPVHKNGMFQIKGLSDEMRVHFSKRREQIKDIIAKMGPEALGSKKLYDAVAQHSKASKKSLGAEPFFERAQQEMRGYLDGSKEPRSFDEITTSCLEKTKAQTDTQLNKDLSASTAREAVMDAVAYLSQFSVTLDAYSILNKAMQFNLGTSDHQQLHHAFKDCLSSNDLLPISNGRFTTRKLIETETVLMSTAKKAVGELNEPPVSAVTLLSDKKTLLHTLKSNLSQSRLCILSDPARLEDKQSLFNHLIPELEKQYKHVRVLTPNKTMSNHHNEAMRQRDTTIWQRLTRIGKGDLASSLGGFLHQYEAEQAMPLNRFLQRKGQSIFIVDSADRMSCESMQKLISLTEKSEARIIFLKNSHGKRSVIAGNPLELIERSGVNQLDAKKAFATKTGDAKVKLQLQEVSVDLSKPSERQAARQMACAKQMAAKSVAELNETLVLTNSKASAEKLNNLIRQDRIESGQIDRVAQNVKVMEPIYLTPQEQKHAKYFPLGLKIKTYVGDGQFRIDTILRHDVTTNKLVIQNERGKCAEVSAKTLADQLKTNKSQLYFEKELSLAVGDRCHVAHSNRSTDALGLKLDQTYTVSAISEKFIEFKKDNLTGKPQRIKVKALAGVALSYDYARSVHSPLPLKRKEKIICELAHHAVNPALVQELSGITDNIVLITDNKAKVQRKLAITPSHDTALDQQIMDTKDTRSSAQKAMEYAVSVVASREAAFNLESLMKTALTFEQGSHDQKALRGALVELVQSGSLLCRKAEFGEVLFATQEAVNLERRIIQQIKDGKGEITPFLSPIAAATFLANKRANDSSALMLTKGQEEACTLLATTTDRFVMIQGYAGTGKSTMLETLVGKTTDSSPGLHTALEAMLPRDRKILALAPTHQAVRELQDKGIQAQTLKSFLGDQQKLPAATDAKSSLSNTLILVDESSMISNTDFYALQSIVELQNARCAYIGDVAQLTAVEAGKPSELIYIAKEAKMATAIMHEHIRQTDPKLKEVAGLLMQGGKDNFATAFQLLIQEGCIRENKGGEHAVLASIAADYTSASPQKRLETLIAVATNKDREALNHLIRALLAEKKELVGPAVDSVKLVDSRLTKIELSYAKHYLPGMIVKYRDSYHQVLRCDVDENTVELFNGENGKTLLPLSHLPKDSPIELYSLKKIEFSPGDLIKFTKTDRDKARLANTPLTIESVDVKTQSFVAKEPDGKTHVLKANEFADQHLDYRYCSTTHGLQGATSKEVLVYLNSRNKHSNTMRQMYVALTRAKEKAVIFTDDVDAVKRQVIHNAGEKTSALQAMGLLETKNRNKPSHTKSKAPEIAESQPRLDAKIIEQTLQNCREAIVKNLLGEPNPALSNAKTWRYGSKGSLSIVVTGDRAGQFYNFETGEKGGMISLIMAEQGVSFKKALEIANRLLGGLGIPVSAKKSGLSSTKAVLGTAEFQAKKQEYIQTLIEKSQPIEGTIADLYLKKRFIKHTENTDLRYLSHVKTGAGNAKVKPFSAALLAIYKDKNGEPCAIQLTYLNKNNGEKVADLPIPKRSIGTLQGGAVDLSPDVKNPTITFVTEGVETGLSIRDATQHLENAQVIATLGKQNMAHIPEKNTADRIVLVLDNDLQNPLEDRAIQGAISALQAQQKRVECIYPTAINNQKTDYNDLAQAKKYELIARDVASVLQKKCEQEHTNSIDREVERDI